MQAEPARISFSEPAAPTSAQVAQGGLVADWHRAIEAHYAARFAIPERQTHGKRILERCSRAAGYAALVAGYVLVGQGIARWIA